MTPQEFLADILDPGLQFLTKLGGPPPTPEVRRFLLCVAMQESGPDLDARYQTGDGDSAGPARGFWQFERGGGVTGVLNHPASRALANLLCASLHVKPISSAVWRAL